LDHVGLVDRRGEARPAGAAVVLVDRGEQGLARHDVDVDTQVLVVAEFAGGRGFGRGLLSDLVLLRGQLGDRLGVLVIGHVAPSRMVPPAGCGRAVTPRGEPRGGPLYFIIMDVSTDDNCRLWTAETGRGEPLIMCHGGPGLWDMSGSLAARLAERLTVIRWDQRGCGRSERRGPYSVARCVADLDAIFGQRTKDALFRHSWGEI